ncbi:MAG: bifunctional lysylphosphatidylglycerol flippase/synthetase MprF [Gaiellaceae bacterium]
MSVSTLAAPRVEVDSARAAIAVLGRHADHSSAFLAMNDETRHFAVSAIDGFVAYRQARGHVIQLCGPFAPPDERTELVRAFHSWARSGGRRVTAVQLRRDDARAHVGEGFTVNQLGSSYSLDLESFDLRGKRFMKLRNKLKRSRRLGVSVEELDPAAASEPATARELARVDAAWLRAQGRLAREMTFMVGERAGRGAPFRRLVAARHDGRITAYVTYSPSFGNRPGWLCDLTRRHPISPPGAVELIIHAMIERLRGEGCRWLHLGLTPFAGLSPEHELARGSSRMIARFGELLYERGGAIYPAQAQEQFKLKWGPHVIEPEYVAFEGRPTLGAIWQLMRVTRAI